MKKPSTGFINKPEETKHDGDWASDYLEIKQHSLKEHYQTLNKKYDEYSVQKKYW